MNSTFAIYERPDFYFPALDSDARQAAAEVGVTLPENCMVAEFDTDSCIIITPAIRAARRDNKLFSHWRRG